MKNTTALPIPQPPPDNNNSSLTIRWDDCESFPSCSTLSFAWNNNSTSNWDSFTPVLFSDDDSKENKSTRILEWPGVAVLENQYSLTMSQIIDQEQRKVHVELWCSNNDNSNPKTAKTLCGKSPQFTLFQPLNHLASINLPITNETYEATTTHNVPATAVPTGTHETTTEPTYSIQTTGVFGSSTTFATSSTNIKKRILASSSQGKPSSPTTKTTKTTKKQVVAQNTSRSNGQGTPTTIAKTTLPTKTLPPPPPKATTTPSTTECPENIPNPSCLPILPSIIAPNLSYNSPFPTSTSSSSSTAKTTTTTTDNTALNNSESYPKGAAAMDSGVIAVIVVICATVFALGLYLLHVWQQRSRGDYGDGEHLRGGGGHRRDDDPETGSRRSSMSSLTTYGRFRSYRVTPPWSLTYSRDCSNREDEQSYGRSYPQVPPVHISPPVLIGDPAVHQHQQHQQRVAALNMDTTHKQTSGSSPLSPVSATSSRCRGRPSASTRYPATAPGGGVATIASAAHALQPRTALPPASSVPSSFASNESDISPTHTWSPFSGRTSPFHRKLTTISSRSSSSSSSRPSSVFSKLSNLSSVSPLPMDKEQDRRVRQGYEAHMVKLPKPASLTRTHISTPIRSIMSISSEEGHVLARQDVLIRMEDDADDYDSDMDVREHQFKKSKNRYSNRSRTHKSRDTFHIRRSSNDNYTGQLPNQLNSSLSTSSRHGLRHHQHQQQQQQHPLYSSHRSSLSRTSYCSSIVPLTPKIPQQYIPSSSAESCLSRGSSGVMSLSRTIGYDPELIDTTEDDGNYDSDCSQYGERRKSDHGRRKDSEEAGRKGSEMSKPISRSVMKAVRHEGSRVSLALPLSKESEWARGRERESTVAANKGGSAVLEGRFEERQRHVGVEYY